MAGAIKTFPTLTERAETLTNEVQGVLGGVASLMLPKEVRLLIHSLAVLVEDMARAVEKAEENAAKNREAARELLAAVDVQALPDYVAAAVVRALEVAK